MHPMGVRINKNKFYIPSMELTAFLPLKMDWAPKGKYCNIPTIHFQVLYGAMLVSGRVTVSGCFLGEWSSVPSIGTFL